jgi:multidrug efflux pump subunit AcrA (membrane-fusion protein)
VQRGALVVPESAVQTGQDGSYVFVIGPDLKASLRRVDVDRTVGTEVVLRSGVSASDRVASDGLVRLRDGAAVQIKTALPGSPLSAPSASAASASLVEPGRPPP